MLEEIELEKIEVDTSLSREIPEEMARENCLVGFKRDDRTLYVAVSNMPDFELVEKLKFVTKHNVAFFKSQKQKIFDFIDNMYYKRKLDIAINSIETSIEEDENSGEDDLKESPVIKTVNYVMEMAIVKNASDIHIEPFEGYLNIRFRIDGTILKFMEMPKKIYPFICTRIKIMAGMDISERRIPQDGKIRFSRNNEKYDIRVSTLPTIYGEKIVMRILYRDRDICSLEKLGFLKKDAEKIMYMTSKQNGMLLCAGPTGSGKSTTIYSILNNVDKTGKNIVSIEDPVEYAMDGISQVNVNNKAGVSFASGLRATLRQDPDIIVVGEIRDAETANIAVRAAITGHFVLSTIHTSSAEEAVFRLESMGIPSYFIKDALIGVISQRLVRKLCTDCRKKEYEAYSSKGCSKCNYTGYSGRILTYEVNFMKNPSMNTTTMKNNSMNLVEKGITSLEEIRKIYI